MSDMVRNWILDALDEKINEANDTIRNERIWANGSPDAETASLHEENIRLQEEYIYELAALKEQVETK